MRTVEFKFDVDQEVTVLMTKECGIVTCLGFDRDVVYCVRTKSGDRWWKEHQIIDGWKLGNCVESLKWEAVKP